MISFRNSAIYGHQKEIDCFQYLYTLFNNNPKSKFVHNIFMNSWHLHSKYTSKQVFVYPNNYRMILSILVSLCGYGSRSGAKNYWLHHCRTAAQTAGIRWMGSVYCLVRRLSCWMLVFFLLWSGLLLLAHSLVEPGSLNLWLRIVNAIDTRRPTKRFFLLFR